MHRLTRPKRRHSKRVAIIVALCFSASTLIVVMGASGSSGNVAAIPTITASGTSTVQYTPATLSMTFGATAERRTAAGAVTANASVMNAIIQALTEAGVRRVTTDSVSLNVRYAQNEPRIIGYDATNVVRAEIKTGDAAGLIDAAVAAGATTIGGPYFAAPADQESLYRAALRQAVAQARGRAATIAAAADVTLGRIVSMVPDLGGVTVATPTAVSTSTPILTPDEDVSASVTIVFGEG